MSRIPCVGEPAPLFEAAAFHDGLRVRVSLFQYRGQWVVLFFYPGDFTCVCPTEMAAMAVKYPALRELGAEVLAVSTDTLESHDAFQEQCLSRMVPGGARFPIVCDSDGAIGSMYGVYDANANREIRSHFIIDAEGTIQSLEVVAAPLGRSMTEILRQLRALQEHQATGRMMPCGWEPGKPTLAVTEESSSPGRPWDSWKPREAF
ncbi:MAG: peroxiredoxin [Syntrophobacteraceae bacterium]|jgi:peroxiredoxin (alkyl hydroperoxide reductase subunit C)|nr:peroxiredoxin [Syntrophobacteraceae bacterium]MCU0588892.1 peroxiredoxin [Syntrophobacteraceae bacterium]